MGKLWDIMQSYIDAQDWPPSERRIADRLEVSPSTLKGWRNPKQLPQRESLEGIAKLTRTPYRSVVEAALDDVRVWTPPSQDSIPSDVGADGKESKTADDPGLPRADESVTLQETEPRITSEDK